MTSNKLMRLLKWGQDNYKILFFLLNGIKENYIITEGFCWWW